MFLAHRRIPATLAGLATLTLLAGCGSEGVGAATADDDDAGISYETGLVNISDAGAPVQGGTLSFGAWGEPRALDPAKTIAAGSTGGVEMAAVYDVLMRWDSTENAVVPQLAESLEASDDSRTWTLRLRDGVSFSDGTPLDSAAVKWSIDRYVANGGDESRFWNATVSSIETPDASTVVFRLVESRPSFGFMLTTGPGMIVAASSDAGPEFTPIGAGPFTLASHRPQERMVLEANESYWGGRPALDTLEVVYLNDPNTTMESFAGGGVDAGFISNPGLVDDLLEDGTSGFLSMVALSDISVINAAEGRPGADRRVRQAMQLAIPAQAVFDRAYEGAGVASAEIFPEFSTLHSDVDALPHDLDRARELLEKAKADGFDGAVTVSHPATPDARDKALTIKASLEAVGFTVELDPILAIADQINQVAVQRDYDVASWSMNWRDAAPEGKMFSTLTSQGTATAGMYVSPEMDALIADFRRAQTLDERREISGRIQEQWNEDVPAVVHGPRGEFIFWSGEVHGVTDTMASMVLLHDAWIDEG
jgi:peptide/nickel transport system substrate-binding protein